MKHSASRIHVCLIAPLALFAVCFTAGRAIAQPTQTTVPAMKWADDSRTGQPFSKDPSVVRFGGRYLMYFSLPPFDKEHAKSQSPRGWSIGIAESTDLDHWTKVAELFPAQDCDQNGLCAPGAIVLDGKVHLFYQTYGNGAKDAICHAVSDDGVKFTRDATNPVFRPTGDWNSGRAIDAEVFPVDGRLMLYFATRDPAMKVQMIGVAAADLNSDFSRDKWEQLVDGPILKPELPWEGLCIEAPTLLRRGGKLFMFYAGNYNNKPQQVGVATSQDGISWKRLSAEPILRNGSPDQWNSSESGHPGVFVDEQGQTHLFFQGNNDRGKTWWLARVPIEWKDDVPGVADDGNCRAGNPVFPGWYADPEGIIFGDRYWIYPTYSAPFDDQLHFDAFSSPDLVNWTKHERILDNKAITWAQRAMWAPAIVKKDDKYFLFFGANDIHDDQKEVGGIGVAVADRPEGPFADYLGKPLIGKIHYGAQPIDQFVFKDTNGTYYMIYGGWSHCNIAKMKPDFTGFVPFDDGTTFKEITPENYVEGPFMFRKDGKYYFMWSEGGWTGPNYSVAYAIADSPLGPFKRIGKVLQQDPNVATGAGHHSVIHEPKEDIWYVVYHRRPLSETDANHRVTCIDRMRFDKDGLIQPIKITHEGVLKRPLPSK